MKTTSSFFSDDVNKINPFLYGTMQFVPFIGGSFTATDNESM